MIDRYCPICQRVIGARYGEWAVHLESPVHQQCAVAVRDQQWEWYCDICQRFTLLSKKREHLNSPAHQQCLDEAAEEQAVRDSRDEIAEREKDRGWPK